MQKGFFWDLYVSALYLCLAAWSGRFPPGFPVSPPFKMKPRTSHEFLLLLNASKNFAAKAKAALYRAFDQTLPAPVQDRFGRSQSVRQTRRSSLNMAVCQHSTKLQNLRPSISGRFIWNSLSSVTRSSNSLESFKKGLKKLLLANYEWCIFTISVIRLRRPGDLISSGLWCGGKPLVLGALITAVPLFSCLSLHFPSLFTCVSCLLLCRLANFYFLYTFFYYYGL